ncbi:PREDICTED: uncharacterized protein LOC104757704 [Camelina sativa]|uniref:Uncharacterized protein LOC104757704 n=1 Tax=Camelina sativa TaxID=90675 RepID=A0ABM1QJY8_CAMSA|nr:PREDICTED: uncharacterized protein LOC104757704 [Camelina sativa]
MESRPGVLVVGSSGVGKRTLLSRLLSVEFEDSSEPSSQTEVHGWTINTKYYTADVSVWISHIRDDYSLPNLPQSHPLVALVMVFDLSEVCLEWCCENNIEFIEACASNPDFDKCLSVDGDSQGVERLFGALSAHMWPGMVLKSGDKINDPVLAQGEELSEEESEYELEYEVLSAGSGDPWENIDERWVSASGTHSYADAGGSTSQENLHVENNMVKMNEVVDEELQLSRPRLEPQSDTDRVIVTDEKAVDTENEKCYEFEDVEQLMSEIGNIRDNLRLMPDFQRKEIAANLAMKMASMFGGDSDDEEEPK